MMKKVLFVIFIAIHPLCYEATEFQEVRLSTFKYHGKVFELGDFYVLDSRPLRIVFEDIDATNVQCSLKHKKLFFKRHGENFFSNGTTIIIINEVTSDMSCKWECHLIDVHNNNSPVYSFEFRIKAAKVVPAFIDRNLLQYTFTNVSVLEYDGVKEYLCEEDLTINLDCQNPFEDGSLILRYYNANGTKIIETDNVDKAKVAEDKLNFRVLMRPEANGSYVECTYFTANQDKQEFTYRIIFIIRKDPLKNDYFTITINDMKLMSKPIKVNDTDIYNYKFIYGENLTITCEKKDKDILADIVMGTKLNSTNGTFINTKDIEKSQSIYKLFVETTYLDQASIEFSLFNSDSNLFLRAMINFYAGSYGGPAIVGLPARDMLYQYNKNNEEWIAHYQYTPNDTLLLTCVTITNKTLRWLQENKIVPMTKGQNNKVGIKYISDMFTLNQNNITCQLVDTKEKSTLVFHRKPDLSPMDPHENNNALDGPQELFVIIGSTVGVLLAILITAIIVFYWYRRYRITNQKDKPSTKFSGNDNPLSDIVRLENNGEYTYITSEYNYIKSDYSAITLNSLYCKNMSNNIGYQRDTTYSDHTENHYTEIDDYSRNNSENLNSINNVTYENNKYEFASSSRDPSYKNL